MVVLLLIGIFLLLLAYVAPGFVRVVMLLFGLFLFAIWVSFNLPQFGLILLFTALGTGAVILGVIATGPQGKAKFAQWKARRQASRKQEPTISDPSELQTHIGALIQNNQLSDRKLYSHSLPEPDLSEEVFITSVRDCETGENVAVYYVMREGQTTFVIPSEKHLERGISDRAFQSGEV